MTYGIPVNPNVQIIRVRVRLELEGAVASDKEPHEAREGIW